MSFCTVGKGLASAAPAIICIMTFSTSMDKRSSTKGMLAGPGAALAGLTGCAGRIGAGCVSTVEDNASGEGVESTSTGCRGTSAPARLAAPPPENRPELPWESTELMLKPRFAMSLS
jgi:hypothetical protein